MKTQKLLFVIVFLFFNISIFSQEEPVKTDINKDTLKVLIKKELTDFFEKDSSEAIGVFVKNNLAITVYNKKDSTKNSFLQNKKDSLELILNELKEINKSSTFDSIKTLEIVKTLLKKELYVKDTLKKYWATRFSKSEIDVNKFNQEIKKINKETEILISQKQKEINKNFGVERNFAINKLLLSKKPIFVEEIGLEIYEGVISDLQVKLSDGSIFSNKTGISLTRMRKYAPRKLYEINGSKKYIILKDVLSYSPYPGKSYLPEDISLTITKNEQSKKLNIKNDLKSFLDFRIYTDFLGLIDEASNGIVNFEASSKIYISPSPIRLLFGWDYHFFKDVRPYVSYSRFDNDNKTLSSSLIPNDPNNKFQIDEKLDLIQNAFVKVGAEFNFIQIKGEKEFPFSIHIPIRLEINMSETEVMDEKISINSHVYGTGLKASLRRFNNFGLNLGFSYDWISPRFSSEKIADVENFQTLGFDSELFFYGNKEKSSAIFLRLSTRRLNGLDKNFSMIQVGYKKAFSFSKTE